MTLRDQLLSNPFFECHGNIFYQNNFRKNSPFEEAYIDLRRRENRIHSDDVVKKLPRVENGHPEKKEWDMRKFSLEKLIVNLKKSGARRIIELGCGNGWFASNIVSSMDCQVCAVDVNEIELLQGSRVFNKYKNLCFVYGDIFIAELNELNFDAVIMAASIQYFPDIKKLMSKLLSLIAPGGQIFIADSPFYDSIADADAAKKRSMDYFKEMGSPEMSDRYFHHTYGDLQQFKPTILHDPHSYSALLRRKLFGTPLSVFPLIRVSS